MLTTRVKSEDKKASLSTLWRKAKGKSILAINKASVLRMFQGSLWVQEKTIGLFFIRLTFYFVSLVGVTKYVFATESDAQRDDLCESEIIAASQRARDEQKACNLCAAQFEHITPLVASATPEGGQYLTHVVNGGTSLSQAQLSAIYDPQTLAASQRARDEQKARDLFLAQLEQITPLDDSATPKVNQEKQEDNFFWLPMQISQNNRHSHK